MLVTFLKNHKQYKEGQEADIPESTAMFLIRCKVATVKADETKIDKTLTAKLKSTKRKKK